MANDNMRKRPNANDLLGVHANNHSGRASQLVTMGCSHSAVVASRERARWPRFPLKHREKVGL